MEIEIESIKRSEEYSTTQRNHLDSRTECYVRNFEIILISDKCRYFWNVCKRRDTVLECLDISNYAKKCDGDDFDYIFDIPKTLKMKIIKIVELMY